MSGAGKNPGDFIFTREDGVQVVDPRDDWYGPCIASKLGQFVAAKRKNGKDYLRYVERGISDLCSQLNRDTTLAKAELQKHLTEVRMTPAAGREGWHYVAEGNWDLLGTGPNAPVLRLAHSDGCGGQI